MPRKSTTAVPVGPRKLPGQRRSELTVATILEAAARILETDGLSAYSTNAIAARAGVSIGSLYQYFPNKDAVTRALIQKNAHALLRDLQATEPDADAQFRLKSLLSVAVKHQLERPALARVLDLEEDRLRMDEQFEATAREAMQVLLHCIANTKMVRPQDLRTACGDLFAIVRGMVNAAGARGERDQAALAVRVYKAVFGYLSVMPGV